MTLNMNGMPPVVTLIPWCLFLVNSSNNMEDVQTCEVGTGLTLLNIGSLYGVW
jgi:hypothetical protein